MVYHFQTVRKRGVTGAATGPIWINSPLQDMMTGSRNRVLLSEHIEQGLLGVRRMP